MNVNTLKKSPGNSVMAEISRGIGREKNYKSHNQKQVEQRTKLKEIEITHHLNQFLFVLLQQRPLVCWLSSLVVSIDYLSQVREGVLRKEIDEVVDTKFSADTITKKSDSIQRQAQLKIERVDFVVIN